MVWTDTKRVKDSFNVAREFSELNVKLSALKYIEVSFEDFHHLDRLMSIDPYGDMEESITIPAGKTTYVTCKPAYDFQNRLFDCYYEVRKV